MVPHVLQNLHNIFVWIQTLTCFIIRPKYFGKSYFNITYVRRTSSRAIVHVLIAMQVVKLLLQINPMVEIAVIAFFNVLHTKGQLFPKCLFGVFNFLQKTNENKSTWTFIIQVKHFKKYKSSDPNNRLFSSSRLLWRLFVLKFQPF